MTKQKLPQGGVHVRQRDQEWSGSLERSVWSCQEGPEEERPMARDGHLHDSGMDYVNFKNRQ